MRPPSWMRAMFLVAMLGLTPALVWADGACPLVTPAGTLWVQGTLLGTLQEATERVLIRAGQREARARELGTFADGCGSLTPLEGTVRIRAESVTPLTSGGLGVGTFTGALHITPADQPDGDDERGRVTGGVTGILDFRPTNSTVTACGGGPCPWVWASGTWTTTGAHASVGHFAGVALVPFQSPTCSARSTTGWCYLDPTGRLNGTPFALVPAVPSDLSGGPEAKFLITLYQ